MEDKRVGKVGGEQVLEASEGKEEDFRFSLTQGVLGGPVSRVGDGNEASRGGKAGEVRAELRASAKSLTNVLTCLCARGGTLDGWDWCKSECLSPSAGIPPTLTFAQDQLPSPPSSPSEEVEGGPCLTGATTSPTVSGHPVWKPQDSLLISPGLLPTFPWKPRSWESCSGPLRCWGGCAPRVQPSPSLSLATLLPPHPHPPHPSTYWSQVLSGAEVSHTHCLGSFLLCVACGWHQVDLLCEETISKLFPAQVIQSISA